MQCNIERINHNKVKYKLTYADIYWKMHKYHNKIFFNQNISILQKILKCIAFLQKPLVGEAAINLTKKTITILIAMEAKKNLIHL